MNKFKIKDPLAIIALNMLRRVMYIVVCTLITYQKIDENLVYLVCLRASISIMQDVIKLLGNTEE